MIDFLKSFHKKLQGLQVQYKHIELQLPNEFMSKQPIAILRFSWALFEEFGPYIEGFSSKFLKPYKLLIFSMSPRTSSTYHALRFNYQSMKLHLCKWRRFRTSLNLSTIFPHYKSPTRSTFRTKHGFDMRPKRNWVSTYIDSKENYVIRFWKTAF